MDWTTIIFYAFGIMTVLSVLFIMFTRNILYAALALIVTFLCLAGIFVFLGAEFIAITQILVYVGGILVLLVFGIMLTNRISGSKVVGPTYNKLLGILASATLFTILFKGIISANFSALGWVDKTSSSTSIQKLGLTLMTDYVLVFELIGLLLLIALIGAIRIAGSTRKEEEDAI